MEYLQGSKHLEELDISLSTVRPQSFREIHENNDSDLKLNDAKSRDEYISSQQEPPQETGFKSVPEDNLLCVVRIADIHQKSNGSFKKFAALLAVELFTYEERTKENTNVSGYKGADQLDPSMKRINFIFDTVKRFYPSENDVIQKRGVIKAIDEKNYRDKSKKIKPSKDQ